LVGNRPEVFVLFWAAMRIGARFTPISIHLKPAEIAWILSSSRARALVVADEFVARLPEALPELCWRIGGQDDGTWPSFDAACAAQAATLPADACEGAPLLFSSGTTGRPKGVVNMQPGAPLGAVSDLARRRMALHALDADTVYLSTAPLYHSAPLRYTEMVLRQGGRAVIMLRFDAEQALGLIEAERITHSQWVPTMFVRLLRLPESVRERHDLSSHRYAVHAAAPCPVGIKRQMLAWWGPILHEYYSATEANGQTVIGPEEWLAHPGSVGRPLMGEVRIRDEAGRDLPAGETGLVYLSGGARFEYLDDPEKTAAAYAPDGFSTLGDIGRLDADGYLYLTDRRDFTIISGGVNIYPQEIEDVLLTHPDVADAAVFGLPDDEFGERVHAAVELVADRREDPAALVAFCREQLAHLKCPRSIEFHARLPRLPTGKLAKGDLRAATIAAATGAVTDAGPSR
ncbi:MAG TPA: AMP-binding protein, partial [Pseudomonadales bacterium]|nr:AMP-binding protein [Pseudomonadales bacterium]